MCKIVLAIRVKSLKHVCLPYLPTNLRSLRHLSYAKELKKMTICISIRGTFYTLKCVLLLYLDLSCAMDR